MGFLHVIIFVTLQINMFIIIIITLSPSQVQTHDIYVAHKKDIALNDWSKVEPAVKEVQQGN